MGTSTPRSVLIIRPSALGDVCRSVPLAASVRAAWPESQVAWLVQDSFADAIRAHPAIDEVILFPRSKWRRWWTPRALGEFREWLRGLRDRFDLVIDAQGLGRSGLMARATRAPRRIGFADAREFGWLGLTERMRVVAPHAVDRMLGLLTAAGIASSRDLRLWVPAEADAWWEEERRRRGLERYALFAPTSRWRSKAWPAESWRMLGESLLARGDADAARPGAARLVLVGSKSEQDEVRAALPGVALQDRAVDLAGATTVGQLMAVIAGSDLVIANDSAALHMAVGLGRPLLALFGPTDPALVGPYGRDHAVLRSPEAVQFRGHYRDRALGDRLMRGIGVDDVLQALDQHRHGLAASEVSS